MIRSKLKKLASSFLSDQIYTQFAQAYGALDSKKEFVALPNNILEEFYDAVALEAQNVLGDQEFQYCQTRSSNNKGNSLEALSLCVLEFGWVSLLWYILWMLFTLSNDLERTLLAMDQS